MIGKTVSHYRILEKLGAGGMGEVYRARDEHLHRDVAIKVLPSGYLADESARKHLRKEAEALSRLSHPNIATVFDFDTQEGIDFLVLEYVPGQTLGAKLASGPLPEKEVVALGVQIASALGEAHETGVIHRDLKPGNIIVTPKSQVKVLDFGLAQVLRPVSPDDSTDSSTAPKAAGTLPYMAPEQLRGEQVDQRTDIYAAGTVIYEMATGSLPFPERLPTALADDILHKPPPPPGRLKPDLSTHLEEIILKCLEKDAENRYQSAKELLVDLRRLSAPSIAAAPARRRALWPIFVLLTGMFTVAGIAWWAYKHYVQSPQVALAFQERDWVLITDFDNLTGDQVFDRSLEAAMTVGIQQSRYVNVFPRNRVEETLQRMRKEKIGKLDEVLGREIAQREGIKALVACSISRVGEVYSLNARLINPYTGMAVLTTSARAKGKNQILDALDDLTKKIREDLGEVLTSIVDQNVRLPQATTSSLEALTLLVEARRLKGKDQKSVCNLLQEAIKLDQDFALAHAELGEYFYNAGDRGKGEEHFTKALSLLDRLTLRERLWIQALADEYRGNREKASGYYRTYLDRYPDDSRGWFRLGYSYLILDRCDQAIEAFKKHLEIVPSEVNAFINIATCYSNMHNYAEAVPRYLKAFEINPQLLTSGNINHEFGFTYIYMGKIKEAEDTFNKMLLTPSNDKKARGHRSLALLNMYRGRYSAAIDHLKESILLWKSLNFKMSEYRDRYYLATAYKTKGMIDAFRAELAAIRILLAASNLAPEWLCSAGTLHARTGMINEANKLLGEISARINDLTADSSIGRSNRGDRENYDLLKGEIELAKGNYGEALDLFQVGNKVFGNIKSSEPLAYCYLISGELDQAISMYEQIIGSKELGNESQEKWILAHYYLGKAYEQKGEREKAIESYESFLNIWKDADPDLVALVDAKRRLTKLKSDHRSVDADPAERSFILDPWRPDFNPPCAAAGMSTTQLLCLTIGA